MMSNVESKAATAGVLPDLRALAGDGTQPGWMVLDAARHQLFTGEIVFDTQPEIRAIFRPRGWLSRRS